MGELESGELLPQLRAWLDAAFATHSLGEQVLWDVQVGMVTTPAGQNSLAMALLVVMASGVVGEPLCQQATIPFSSVSITESQVNELVAQMLEELRTERSSALVAELAQTNGHAPGVARHLPES